MASGGRTARKGASARSPYSFVAVSGSISSANRFGAISVTRGPMGRSKTSAKLLAGSVETIRVRFPACAVRTAVAAARVVFPTPPLPEKNVYLCMSRCTPFIDKRPSPPDYSPAATAAAGGASPARGGRSTPAPDGEAEQLLVHFRATAHLSLIHISEPTRLGMISYA